MFPHHTLWSFHRPTSLCAMASSWAYWLNSGRTCLYLMMCCVWSGAVQTVTETLTLLLFIHVFGTMVGALRPYQEAGVVIQNVPVKPIMLFNPQLLTKIKHLLCQAEPGVHQQVFVIYESGSLCSLTRPGLSARVILSHPLFLSLFNWNCQMWDILINKPETPPHL